MFIKTKLLKAFTLAEVIIVLGIIGIVAQCTIPTMINNITTQVNINVLKKSLSMLSQAYTMAVQENGTPDTWGLTGNGDGSVRAFTFFTPFLKVTKNCGLTGSCFTDDKYAHLYRTSTRGNLNEDTAVAKIQLADGSALGLAIISDNCASFSNAQLPILQNLCGYFYVDTNGFKKPNVVGKDMFLLYFTKNGIVPAGTATDTFYDFNGECISLTNASGWGCTAWVIYNGNMDYLKCPSTLSWDGKHTCN